MGFDTFGKFDERSKKKEKINFTVAHKKEALASFLLSNKFFAILFRLCYNSVSFEG